MTDRQHEINLNVQERLRTLEVQHEIDMMLLVALISTHPDRTSARGIFQRGSEHLVSKWLSKPLAEDWLETGVEYRDMLLRYFDQPIAPPA